MNFSDQVYMGCEGDPDVGGTALGYVFQNEDDCWRRCSSCVPYDFWPNMYSERQVLMIVNTYNCSGYSVEGFWSALQVDQTLLLSFNNQR